MTSRAIPVPSSDPIVAAFDRCVARDPGRALLFGPSGSLSRSGVDALAQLAGQSLAQAALPAFGLVAVVASNGASFLAAFLACLRRAHPAVLLDPGMTPAEVERVAAKLACACVLRATADEPRGLSDFQVERRDGASSRADLAGTFIKLTSGSSGEPRGVVTSSAAFLADDEALRAAMRIGDRDRLVAMVPFSHAYGLGSLVAPALVAGIPLLVPARGSPFAPLRLAADAGGTVLPTVPAWVAAMARVRELPAWPKSLATVVTAGAPLLPASATAFRTRFGPPIHVLYGASECGAIAYDRDGGAGERGTVGEPVPGVRVELMPTSGCDGVGQIAVASAAVALRYFPEPDASLAGGRFVSQDLALLEGRELRLAGRLDQVINIRGLKVHPHEIERVISELELVEDVVVDAMREPPSAGSAVRAVVAAPSGKLTPDQVIAWCRSRLSDHKVPRRVLIVPAIPRTERAKPDRAALEALDHA